MPVRHRDLAGDHLPEYGVPEPKRCKHCDESRGSCGGSGGGAGPGGGADGEGGSWRVTLDHDLVETLSAIYPEWFKPQQHRRAPPPPASSDCDEPHTPHTPRSDDTQSSGSSDMAASGSSEASCASGSDARSPGLSPPRLSPPKAVVDASPLQQAMDRNKESLKMKLMMRRPINQLVAQGIMPPLKTPPAYHEQRIQLERAKTGDLLKAKIQRRPDRQELERRHILELQEGHVDPSLAEKQRMLKKARLADQLNDQLSHRPGPLELIKKNILHTEEPIEDAVKRDLVAFRATSEGASIRPSHPSSYCVPPDEHSPSPSPPSTLSPASVASPPLLYPAPGKDKNRKTKSKLKQAPKARQIKFHEYKGPPSAHKASSPPSSASETSYDLLLQQQQLLLQLMRSAAPVYSPVASPAASDSSDVYCAPPAPPPPPPPPPAPARIEEMKVSELRAECKRHKLRVSGPKPQLIDRLRPFLSDECPRSPASSMASLPSPDPRADSLEREPHPSPADDVAQSQPRHIEELQRELEAVLREAASVAAAGDQQQGKRLLQAKIYVSRLRAQLEALQQPPAPVPPPPPPPAQPPPPRYILATPEPSPDRLVRLIAVPPHTNNDSSDIEAKVQSPAYILNGVKVVPIAILPSHYEPQQLQAAIQAPMQATIQTSMQTPLHAPSPSPPPPTPPALLPAPDTGRRLADDMDDVLQILVDNGELPRSAVSSERDIDTDFLVSEPFSPGEVLSRDEILGDRSRLVGDDLQRELNDIQNEILQHADLHGVDGAGTVGCPSNVVDDLTVDLMSNDGFATDFSGQNGDAHDLFGSFLRGENERAAHEPMDINECARDGVDCGDSDTDVFGNIGELTFASLRDEDMSGHAVFGEDPPAHHEGLDLKDFDIELDCDTNMSVAPSEHYDYMEQDVIPNLFGRGHQPQCDPLLGGVPARTAPRPAHLLYSWDRIDYDGT